MNYFAFIRSQYRFLLFGFLMMGLSNYGQTFFIALYSGEIRATFGLSNAGFGALYSAMTLLSAIVMVYSGRLIDNWALPRFTAFVLLGLAVGCVLMGLATQIFWLAVALFMLRHFGQALSSHTGIIAISRAYDGHRGQAVSLIQLGYAGFEGVFPLMAVGLIAWIGWQQSWSVYAIALIVIAVPVQLILSRAEPPRADVADTDDTGDKGAAGAATASSPNQVLRDKRFYMVLPLYMASPFLLTGMFFHQVPLADARGWDLGVLAAAFSLYAGLKVVTSLVTGPLVDRYTARRILPILAVPLLLGMWLILLPDNLFGGVTPFVYMGLLGVHLGMAGPVSGGLWPELFGTKYLGSIRSITTPIMVASTAASPVLFGLLLDAQISFEQLAAGAMMFVVAAAMLAFLGLRDKV